MTDTTADNVAGPAHDGDGADTPLNGLLHSAMELSNEGDLEQAIAVCKDAIARFPGNAEPYFVLGTIAYRCGDEGQALAMVETAHRMDPDSREYVQMLSTVSTRVGRLADGVYYAKIAQASEPHPYLSTIMPEHFLDFEAALQAVRPSLHGPCAITTSNGISAMKK